MNIHESILERWESRKHFGFPVFLQNAPYSAIFTQILGIVVQTPEQPTHSFISVTGLEKLDNLLNNIKTKALECLNYVYRYMFENVPNQVKSESPFLPKAVQLCPYIISSLLDLSQRPNIDTLMDDESYHNMLVECIETLAMFAAEKEFYEIVMKWCRALLVNVGLTLMRTGRTEYEQMIKDPESFVNLALDTCDKQKSKVVKT